MKENQKGNECMELNKELLVNLTEVNGIAGNETQVRELFKKETESYVDGIRSRWFREDLR